MRDAGVVTVLKHWPGHGSASNSHTGPARVAPLADLEERDLLPFDRELADGAPVVMVGHLLSRGLTVDGVPTSLSRRALHYLRRSAGRDTVLADRLVGHGGGQLVAGHQPGARHGAGTEGRSRLGDGLRRASAAGRRRGPPGAR